MNSIFGNNPSQPTPQNGASMNPNMQMIQQFNQFKNSFKGDPKQMVMNMLSSGQMSNPQFQQLAQMARQFRGLIK